MSRWYIEKSGTGIEKSGTGIEKSGTGIEKSGTGIEKSGTGIEKSGTGIRQALVALSIAATMFASTVSAGGSMNPAGSLQLVVERDTLAVSWIIDGSVFAGVSSMRGTSSILLLTEVSVASDSELLVVGGGTGKEVVGGGTGKEVVGGGTGIEVVGGGTGAEVVGGGTGAEVVGGGTGAEVVGGGTGSEVVGGGTGSEVVGGGTGLSTLVVGGGTGSEAISVTLPDGTGMQMEVTLDCNSATVSILDASYAEVVTFDDVPVIGAAGFCTDEQFAALDGFGSGGNGSRTN